MFFNTSKFLQPSLLLPHPCGYNSVFLFPFHLPVTSGLLLTILNGLPLSRCQLQCVTGNNSTRDYHPRCPKRRALGLHSEAACFVCFSCCMFHTSRSVTSFSDVSNFCDLTRRAYYVCEITYMLICIYIYIHIHTYVINTTPFSRIRILEVPPKLPVVLVKRAIKTKAFMK